MELLQLKYFCHAAETQNFTQTARAFRVPPSNISQCVKRLEEELGEKLFVRAGNRVSLNSRGQLFYQEVQKALALLEQAQKNASNAMDNAIVRVGIGLRRREIQNIIERFREKYPEAEIRTSRFWMDSDPEAYDIIITDDELQSDNFTSVLADRRKIYLTALKGTLPEGPSVTAEQLRDLTFICLQSNSVMHKNTLRVCRDLGFEPKLLMQEEYSYYYVPRCVEEGLGVALVPEDNVWLNFVQEVLERKDVGEYYRDVCFYRRKKPVCAPQLLDQLYNYLLNDFVGSRAKEKEA